jgi:hypothetical protein
VQLFCIFIGLWVCIPAALLQKKTTDLSENASGWIGEIGGVREKLLWLDCMLLLIFGGIPWQVRNICYRISLDHSILPSRSISNGFCLLALQKVPKGYLLLPALAAS